MVGGVVFVILAVTLLGCFCCAEEPAGGLVSACLCLELSCEYFKVYSRVDSQSRMHLLHHLSDCIEVLGYKRAEQEDDQVAAASNCTFPGPSAQGSQAEGGNAAESQETELLAVLWKVTSHRCRSWWHIHWVHHRLKPEQVRPLFCYPACLPQSFIPAVMSHFLISHLTSPI